MELLTVSLVCFATAFIVVCLYLSDARQRYDIAESALVDCSVDRDKFRFEKSEAEAKVARQAETIKACHEVGATIGNRLKDAIETADHNKRIADELSEKITSNDEAIDQLAGELLRLEEANEGYKERETLYDLALEEARIELTDLRAFVNAIRTRAITLTKGP